MGIYVLNKFQVKKSITQYNFSKSECLWLDISENNFKTELTVGAVYRHPGQTKIIEFIDEFTNSLSDLSQNKKVYYILGDFNINLNRDNRTNSANLYINSILSHGAIPLITKPTRISNNSSTIIDHIITNDSKHELQSFIVKSDLTDHYPIFCVINKNSTNNKKNIEKLFYRDKTKFCTESFCKDLQTDLDNYFSHRPTLSNENFNELFNSFVHIISHSIDTHAPLRPISRRMKKLLQKPWITKGLLTSIKKKRRMFKSHFLSGEKKKSFYKVYSNKLTKLKTLSKKLYYTSKFDECQKDARKVWNVIRSMLPNSKPINDTPDSLVTDRGTTSDYQNIADEFNKFFCSIGSNLANNFSNTSFKSFSTYLTKRVSSSIYLNIPNHTEIFNAIYSLKNNKAVGHDGIPAFFLRITSSVIIPYLQVFIEFCFTEGTFPENCTIARIVPIFKKGERDKPTNYRPISILTCFSKIFE